MSDFEEAVKQEIALRFDEATLAEIASKFPTKKPHVSFSEISDWAACSYRHKLKHVSKIEMDDPSVHLAFGHAIHASCEGYLKTRAMDVTLGLQKFDEEWKPEFLNKRNPADPKEKDPPSQEEWRATLALILADVPAFMDKQFPNWEYINAEELLYETIEPHEIKFKGFIDGVIRCTGPRNKILTWIIDWKTSNYGWRREKRDDFMTKAQIVLYKSFWAKKHSLELKDIRCAFVILKKNAKPNNRIDFFPVSVGEVTAARSLKIVNNMVVAVGRNIAIKNRDSCRFCDYFETEHCT